MAITVRGLVQRRDLGLSLVAGRENGDRAIAWAHAIELADPTPYLSGAELVMTTGMNVGSTDAEQFDYINRLSLSRVAAVALDTGTTLSTVPRGIISAADAVGMPVLAVPPRTPFIAITRAVIDEITADELRAVQRVVDQQEVMVRETLRRGIPAVVAALSKALAASVVVMETRGNVLASAGPDADRIAQVCADRLQRTRRGKEPASQVIADGDAYCIIQGLRATQHANRHLLVRTKEPLSAPNRLLVSHAVALISLEMDKPAEVVDAEQRLRTAVTRLATTQPNAVEPGILRYFNFDPDDAIRVLALTRTGPAIEAEQQALRLLRDEAIPFLLAAEQDEMLIVLPDNMIDRAEPTYRSIGAQLGRQIGGGLSAQGYMSILPRLVSQARTAARATPDNTCLNDYGGLSIFGVVLANRTTEELRLLAEQLDPIDGPHSTKNASATGLLETLTAYLNNNGSIENSAAALGIHRHTLRNRIAKISSLLGRRDLTAAGTMAELWLAVKARELLAQPCTPPDQR